MRPLVLCALLLIFAPRAAMACPDTGGPFSLWPGSTQDERPLHAPKEAVEEAIFDNCFLAGTLVVAGHQRSDGQVERVLREVQQVKADDLVLAQDPLTGEVGYRRVVRTFENVTTSVVSVTVGAPECLPVRQAGRTERHAVGHAGEEGGEDAEPPSASQTIRCTPGHPWRVRGADRVLRWVFAGDLRVGDRLVPEAGPEQVVLGLDVREEVARTFNFEVEGWHTYYVSGAADQPGVLVHNRSRAASFVYRLVNKKSGAVYYGIARGRTNLGQRFLRHQADPHKVGQWDAMEVIGKNLTHSQARNLEAGLIKQRLVATGATGKTFAQQLANSGLLNKNRGRLWDRVRRSGGPQPGLLAPPGMPHATLDPLSHLSPARQLNLFGF